MNLFSSKKQTAETPYSFQERFGEIKRIAIIYPEKQEWLRIARYALQKLYRMPEQFEFLILQSPDAHETYATAEFEVGDMVYSPNKVERGRIRNRIQAYNPDILLQLEPEPDDRLIQLLQSLIIGLKIGFGPEESGLNIVYSQKKTGFYEKNILNLVALLESK
ncbi:MAG: hypothetical protein K9N38_08775 [Candidatus Marinimicrobia bacterium]|nr:hypothetical protein [Candidatus Neomarinimicrobiota bacterium]MCF7851259.1 hypothetical protein [Candidatus Neomarinimicrobiota bacterium]